MPGPRGPVVEKHCSMTFAQRRNRLTTRFSERIPVVKRRISLQGGTGTYFSPSTFVFPTVSVAARPLTCWWVAGSKPDGGMDVCFLWMLCCQVEVSASGWSLGQRSPAECGVCVCDREAWVMRTPWPSRDYGTMKKLILPLSLLRCIITLISESTLAEGQEGQTRGRHNQGDAQSGGGCFLYSEERNKATSCRDRPLLSQYCVSCVVQNWAGQCCWWVWAGTEQVSLVRIPLCHLSTCHTVLYP